MKFIAKLIALGCMFSMVLNANSSNEVQYWLMQNVTIKANERMQYEKNIEAMIDGLCLQKNDTTIPWFTFINAEDGIYSYVTPYETVGFTSPMESFDHLMNPALVELHQQTNFKNLNINSVIMAQMPDLSYRPLSTSMLWKDNVIEVMTIHPDKEREFETLLSFWATSFKKAKINLGWTTFKVITQDNSCQYSIIYNVSSISALKGQFQQANLCTEKDLLLFGEGLEVLRSYSCSTNKYASTLSNPL